MSDKNRNMLMLLAGGYLVYVGCRLTLETQKSHPTNETLFIAFGVIFALFGVFVMGIHIRRFWLVRKRKKQEQVQNEFESLEEIADTPRKAIPVRQERTVQMIKLEEEEKFSEEDDLLEEDDFIECEEEDEPEEDDLEEDFEEDDFIEEDDLIEEDDFIEEKDETCESDDEEELEEIRLERI